MLWKFLPARNSPTWPVAGLLLVGAVAIWLRLADLHAPTWLDELHTAWSVSAGIGEVAPRAAAGNQGPVFFYLVWFVVTLTGMSEAHLRLIPYIAGLACLPLAFMIARRWCRSATAGLYAAAAIAVAPHCIRYAVEARPYSLVQFLALAHVGMLERTLRHASVRNRVVVLILGWLLFYTHYTAAMLFVAEVVAIGVAWGRLIWGPAYGSRRSYSWSHAAIDAPVFVLGCLPAWPMVRLISSRRENWEMFIQQPTGWEVATVFDGDVYALTPWMVLAVFAFVVFPLLPRRTDPAERGKRDRVARFPWRIRWYLGWSACWWGVPLLSAAALAYAEVGRLFHPRYVMVAALAPMMLGSLALGAARPHARAVLLVFSLLVLCAVDAGGHRRGTFHALAKQGEPRGRKGEDWQRAARIVEKRLQAAAKGNQHAAILVQSGLIEANGLDADSSEEFRNYCMLPLENRLIRFERGSAEWMPLKATGTKLMVPSDIENRLQHCELAVLVIRGNEPRAVATTRKVLRQLREHGLWPKMTVRFATRGVHVVELALRE